MKRPDDEKARRRKGPTMKRPDDEKDGERAGSPGPERGPVDGSSENLGLAVSGPAHPPIERVDDRQATEGPVEES
jgi:hypothetical protein